MFYGADWFKNNKKIGQGFFVFFITWRKIIALFKKFLNFI